MTVRVNLGEKPPAPPKRRVQRGMLEVSDTSGQLQPIAPVNMSNALLHISTVDSMVSSNTSNLAYALLTAGGHIASSGELKFYRSKSKHGINEGPVIVYWQVEDYV